MRNYIKIYLPGVILLFALGAQSQTREDLLQKAYAYTTHTWIAESENIWPTQLCGGKTVETPFWVVIGNNTSVPYCWGGHVSIAEFDSGLLSGLSAGDANTSSSYGAPNCATGVDCSGFVSQVWGSGRYTTSSFKNISYLLDSYQDLEPTDIVNKASSHVRMVYELNPNGSITMIEAATGNALVGGKGLYKVFTWTYTPANLLAMQAEGYVPRRYGKNAPSIANNDCGTATVLSSSVLASNTLATVTGATSSGMAIPSCSGWTSGSALDAWFSFTATSNTHAVTVSPIDDLDAVVSVYSECSAGSLITCYDAPGGPGKVTALQHDGFIEGETYYIRVFDYGSEHLQPANGKFDIAVTHRETCNDIYEPNNSIASATAIILTNSTFTSEQSCIGGADNADMFFIDTPDSEQYLTLDIDGTGIACSITTGGISVPYDGGMLINTVGGINVKFEDTGWLLKQYRFTVSVTSFAETSEPILAENGHYTVSGQTDEPGYIKLSAVADPDAVFIHWMQDGKILSADSIYVTRNTPETPTLPLFALKTETVYITADASGECGTVSGSGYFLKGATVSLTAHAGQNCTFSHFSIDGNVVEQDTVYSFNPSVNTIVKAHFNKPVWEETNSVDLLSIYPNPAGEYIIVDYRWQGENTYWSIYSARGEEVLRGQLDGDKTNIEVGKLSSGLYVFKLHGLQQTINFTKE